MTEIETDILIIGSGAAGAVLAATLSELTDKRITIVEKGGYYDRTSFDQRELDMLRLYADRGARSTIDGAFPVQGGECVGGGTTVNFALSFDPIESVWSRWKSDHGLRGFSFDADASDYGVTGLNMIRCRDEIRKRINVHPVAVEQVNDNNKLFEEGCRRLGVSTKPFELNMRDCIGCGYCGQGCAYDHKQGTMITYMRDALSRDVRLIHHCDIESVDFGQSFLGTPVAVATGATGIVRKTAPASRPNSVAPGPIRIIAPLTIVAAGSIGSPALLVRSRYPDTYDTVGRGLILHPSLPIGGLFDHRIKNYRGITGSRYSDQYYASHGFYYECLFDHPVNTAVAVPRVGVEHFETMLRYRELAGFGVMLVDTVQPSNRVGWDEASAKPVISYRLSDADKARLRFAAEKGVEIMFAAGAREVFLTSEEPIGTLPYPRFTSADQAPHCASLTFAPAATLLTSAHCQSSAKMGEDPKMSVVDSRCETHHARNLVVCDSSSFPTSCGANPMISVMTLARYQGKRIAAELPRYGL